MLLFKKIIFIIFIITIIFFSKVQRNLSNININFLGEIFQKNGGGFVNQPEEVKIINKIINDLSLQDYSISGHLEENTTINHRIKETNWPLRYNPNSKNLFSTSDDIYTKKTCSTIIKNNNIILCRI